MYSGHIGCIRAKIVVFGLKLLYSGKEVVFGQSCCFRAKKGCVRAKVDVFGQKWLYLDRMVVLRLKCLYSGKSGCFRETWLYSDKVVVFGQIWL